MKTTITTFTILLSAIIWHHSSHALTNSIPAESKIWEPVVHLAIDTIGEGNESYLGYCTGTLLDSRMVITAAHCVKDIVVSKHKDLTVEVGEYRYKQNPDGTRRRIGYVGRSKVKLNDFHILVSYPLLKKFLVNKYRASIHPWEDVAVIWWDQPTPEFENVNFAQVMNEDEYKQLGSSNIKNFDLRVVTVNPIAEINTINTKKISYLEKIKLSFLRFFSSHSYSRVEPGDSGAPLFATIRGKLKIAGVVKGFGKNIIMDWDAFAPVAEIACSFKYRLPDELGSKICR